MKSRVLNSHPQVHYPLKLYADGGVIFKNPSPYGVTCAFVIVNKDSSIQSESFMFTHSGLSTNNQSELLSIILGLESLSNTNRAAIAEVCSDSNVSLGRVFRNYSMSNIPEWTQVRLSNTKKSLVNWDKFSYTLLDGHPTKKQLDIGMGKRGHPVSIWNKICDDLCQQESEKFMTSIKVS